MNDPEAWRHWSRDAPFQALGFFLEDDDRERLGGLYDEFHDLSPTVGKLLEILADSRRVTIIFDQED